MEPAKLPANEKERLQALHDYSILDTLPEDDLDDITKLASEICQTPISLISLIDHDRQWFKSKHGQGIDDDETARDLSFCAHAILNPYEIFTIEDTKKDMRFHDNPFVTGDPYVVFYSGVPLVDSNGMALGSLCVIDNKPRKLSDMQLLALRSLASQVMKIIELRKANQVMNSLHEELASANRELEIFASRAAHDMKSPLNQIHQVVDILMEDHHHKLDDEAKDYMQYLKRSSIKLNSLIDGILKHSRTSVHTKREKEEINITEFLAGIISLIDFKEEIAFGYPRDNKEICINKSALEQIFLNIVSNAIKYNDKEKISINVDFSEDTKSYVFSIRDNGPGIEEKYREKIFVLFEVLNSADRFGAQSTGIGLATVKKLVDSLGGSIRVESEIGEGTSFIVSIPK